MNANQHSQSTMPPPISHTPQIKKMSDLRLAAVIIGCALLVAFGLVVGASVIASTMHGRGSGIGQILKPEMPVTVTYRQSLMGEAYVAQFFNRSDRHLVIVCDCENPTLGARKAIRVEIAPRATVELGWVEGWKFVSGDKIRLSHADYADLSKTIP